MPAERTARVKGWRMDCIVAIWLRQHPGGGGAERGVGEGVESGVLVTLSRVVKSQRAKQSLSSLSLSVVVSNFQSRRYPTLAAAATSHGWFSAGQSLIAISIRSDVFHTFVPRNCLLLAAAGRRQNTKTTPPPRTSPFVTGDSHQTSATEETAPPRQWRPPP